MKICFIVDNFYPEVNAVASRVYERALYWVKWGHEVTVVTSVPNFPEGKVHAGYKNAWKQTEMIGGIKVIRVKTYIASNYGKVTRIIDFLSFMVTSFFAGLRVKESDVIVVNTPQFFSAISAWAVAKIKKKPFVLEIGDLWPESITAVGIFKKNLPLRLLEKIELFLYRQASAVVTLTESFRENLINRGIDPNKIITIINGTELSQYKPKPKDLDLLVQYGLQDKFVVGYVGTIGMAHDLSNAVVAAEYLKFNKKIHFVFVGPGADREKIIELAKIKQLSNCTFVDMQPKEVIANYWSICDVALVHLKNNVAFTKVIPSKIFEAAAMGLPILLVAPTGEATQLLEQENMGWIVAAGEPKMLADTILKLSDDVEKLTFFKKNNQTQVLKYTREIQATRFINVLLDQI